MAAKLLLIKLLINLLIMTVELYWVIIEYYNKLSAESNAVTNNIIMVYRRALL